eukprot:761077-Hanusia_phi.AAC.5
MLLTSWGSSWTMSTTIESWLMLETCRAPTPLVRADKERRAKTSLGDTPTTAAMMVSSEVSRAAEKSLTCNPLAVNLTRTTAVHEVGLVATTLLPSDPRSVTPNLLRYSAHVKQFPPPFTLFQSRRGMVVGREVGRLRAAQAVLQLKKIPTGTHPLEVTAVRLIRRRQLCTVHALLGRGGGGGKGVPVLRTLPVAGSEVPQEGGGVRRRRRHLRITPLTDLGRRVPAPSHLTAIVAGRDAGRRFGSLRQVLGAASRGLSSNRLVEALLALPGQRRALREIHVERPESVWRQIHTALVSRQERPCLTDEVTTRRESLSSLGQDSAGLTRQSRGVPGEAGETFNAARCS